MIKIKYSIQEVRPSIFAVVVPDSYQRAMLFLRYQEFYESPNSKFRGKGFSIWEYVEWYSRERKGNFTYAADWSGFNFPLQCMIACLAKTARLKDETPYDRIMSEICDKIFKANGKRKSGYVIGVNKLQSATFMHEICHGLYCTNPRYKKIVNRIVKQEIDPDHYLIFKDNLLQMGYTLGVIDDEIQAYLLFGYDSDKFGRGVPLRARKKYNDILFRNLKEIIYEGQ